MRQPSSQSGMFVHGCGRLTMRSLSISKLRVESSFGARGAQKREHRLVGTPVDLDSVIGIMVDFIYCMSSFNFASNKPFISFILYYLLIGKYFYFIMSGCLQVGILELILIVLKFQLKML